MDYEKIRDKILDFRDKRDWKQFHNPKDKELKQYIINAYKVMMTRWIRWCYVYAYNKWLKDYLSQFINRV